jgi:hypothetical protein
MALDSNIADGDDQDQAEAFDETLTAGDDVYGEPDSPDVARDAYDVTSADGDDADDDEADEADAADFDDEALDDLDGDADEDDLDDRGADSGPLADDNVQDFSTDRDGADEDRVDGVAAQAPEEAEVIAMGDLNDLSALETGRTVSDLEPDDVSDEALEDLGYKD